MVIEIEVFEDSSGHRPFEAWFDRIPAEHAAKVTIAIARVGVGHVSGLKPVGQGVFERRIDWGPGLRIYLGFDGPKLVILLGGGDKRRQSKDVAAAQEAWTEYKSRKRSKA